MTRWSYDGCVEEEKGWNGVLRGERLGVVEEEEEGEEGGRAPFDEQLRHCVAVVLGRVESVCSGEEALRALVVWGAVRESLERGGPVDVDVDVGAF